MPSLTPPNLTAQTSIANPDLMLAWPSASNGPLQQVTWANVKAQLSTDLTGTFLKAGSNLSDLANPTIARTSLGLGSAALANVGTSGAALPTLNTANTWSSPQTFNGDFTRPNMPAFAARMNATAANVTGDGSKYSVVWDTEVFDRANSFDGTNFTAPLTGVYQLNAHITLSGVSAAVSQIRVGLNPGGSPVYFEDIGDVPPDVNGRVGVSISALVPMIIGGMIHVEVTVWGVAKVVSIYGETNQAPSAFSGFFVG